jgi:hypothetical protein
MTERHTARFVGGPLDGREDELPECRAVPGNIVTHTYLHAGPKIEAFYRLHHTDEGRWEYRLLHPR